MKRKRALSSKHIHGTLFMFCFNNVNVSREKFVEFTGSHKGNNYQIYVE